MGEQSDIYAVRSSSCFSTVGLNAQRSERIFARPVDMRCDGVNRVAADEDVVGTALSAYGDRLSPDGSRYSGKSLDLPASASPPISRRALEKSWRGGAVSRRSRVRGGHVGFDHHAASQFEMVSARDRLAYPHRLPYRERFNITYLWEANRVLGLDLFDWLILFCGAVLSGSILLFM